MTTEPLHTTGILDLARRDDRIPAFLNDCVRKFRRGDYGTASPETIALNKQAHADQQGTVYGFYKAFIATGDHNNEVWVAQDGPDMPVVLLLPSER